MAGKIKNLIDQIVEQRSKGNAIVASSTRTKLILKGINPTKYNEHSEDDPVILQKLMEIAKELS